MPGEMELDPLRQHQMGPQLKLHPPERPGAPGASLSPTSARRPKRGLAEAAPRRTRLSDDVVAAIENMGERQLMVWDSDLAGFCLRVHPGGRKVFCVRRSFQGRPTLYTIGAALSDWSTDEARVKARDVLASFKAGRNPTNEKRLLHGGPTVAALIERYLAEGPSSKPAKRASSWKADRSNLVRHALPLIGKLRVHHLRRGHITAMTRAIIEGETAGVVRTKARGYARMKGGLGSARRVLQTTAAMFAWAVEQELMTANPARAIRLPAPTAKERRLSEAEAGRLLAVLAEMESHKLIHPRFAATIRLLLFTGARKGEILGLQWSEVDLVGRRLVLPGHRTKSGGWVGQRRIPLSAQAIAVLEGVPRRNEWVFPAGRRMSGHAKGLQKPWERLCAHAGLTGLRVHDLRHSFASLALAKNENLVLISRVLGHTTTRMTERYIHTDDRDLQGLVQRTADAMGW